MNDRILRSQHKGGEPQRRHFTNETLVQLVEERLRSHNNRDKAAQWRLNKKKQNERADLIRIARNLDLMLREVPHGGLAKVLAASGFSAGKGEVHGVRGNIAIPHTLIEVGEKHLRRLTPVVHRYVDVACLIETDRSQALGRLFAGTSLDVGLAASSDRDWADRLSDALIAMAARVAIESELGPLFDRLSRENLHVAEDFGAEGMLDDMRLPELRVTEWLSETFHKTDLFGFNPNRAIWLFDRNDEGTPLCGAALFSPKVCITRAQYEWSWDLEKDSAAKTATIKTNVRDYLALVPLAETLELPARVAPWLLRRPEATIRIEGEPERQILRIQAHNNGKALIYYDEGGTNSSSVHITLPKDWQAPFAAELFFDNGLPATESPDLAGCWHACPATAEHLRQAIGVQLIEGIEVVQLNSKVSHPDLSGVIGASDGPDAIDWNALEPGIYAPWNSAAAAMQHSLSTGELATKLTEAVARLAAGHQELHHRLIARCPIAEEMLWTG